MVSDVLVPADSSEYTERACELAVELFPDARIHLLHVLDPTDAGHTGEVAVPAPTDADWHERRQEEAEGLLGELAAEMGERSVSASPVARFSSTSTSTTSTTSSWEARGVRASRGCCSAASPSPSPGARPYP